MAACIRFQHPWSEQSFFDVPMR